MTYTLNFEPYGVLGWVIWAQGFGFSGPQNESTLQSAIPPGRRKGGTISTQEAAESLENL